MKAKPTRTITPVLLSGGSGTRLWPVSRSLHPKQLLPLTSELTMFQETAKRFADADDFGSPVVVCNDEHRFIVAAQVQAVGIRPEAIILSPKVAIRAGRAAAALILKERAPDDLMLLAASDHVIDDVPALIEAVRIGARAAAMAASSLRDQAHTSRDRLRLHSPRKQLDGTPGAFAVAHLSKTGPSDGRALRRQRRLFVECVSIPFSRPPPISKSSKNMRRK
jgi:hypothetical protein